MNSRKAWVALGAGAVLVFGVTACGDESDSDGGGGVSGSLSIDGSSTVQPFAEAAVELYKGENDAFDASVGAAGTGGGFEKFCAGETNISNASRSIEAEEVELCKQGGVTYAEVQVANDGIAVVTNPGLAISCLTVDQLAQLWSDDAVTNYSELGNDAETGEPLPNADVSLYGPGTDSGTFDYFTEEISGEEGRSRKQYQPSEDDNVLVEGVAGDANGSGYFGFSYYEQNRDALNLVSVNAGQGCVEPTADSIQSGEYAPLARPLFMYPSGDTLAEPVGEGFMTYAVGNYQSVAEAAQIVPMSEEQAAQAKSALQAGATG